VSLLCFGLRSYFSSLVLGCARVSFLSTGLCSYCFSFYWVVLMYVFFVLGCAHLSLLATGLCSFIFSLYWVVLIYLCFLLVCSRVSIFVRDTVSYTALSLSLSRSLLLSLSLSLSLSPRVDLAFSEELQWCFLSFVTNSTHEPKHYNILQDVSIEFARGAETSFFAMAFPLHAHEFCP